jgi:predicted  nucleic acid-binding Zn-ribbon protein
VILSAPVCLLERIQRIDLEIDAIGKEGEDCRRDFENASTELKEIEHELGVISSEIDELEGAKRDIEEKLRLNTEKVAADEQRLGEITKEKQYSALTKEIANAQKAMKLHEMELASVKEKIEKKKDELEKRDALFKEKGDEVARASNELEAKEKRWEEAIGEKMARRETVAGSLSPALLKRYETIKDRRGGVGVVQVKDETCLGCYMNVPPQTYLQIVKGTEEIITCPNCHRILYFEESREPPEKPSGHGVV